MGGEDGGPPILLSGEREVSPAANGCYIQEGAMCAGPVGVVRYRYGND